jgi:hypothetical protein
METTPRAVDAHPIELGIVCLLALGLALRELIAGLIALAGAVASYGRPWRCAAPAAATPAPAPAAVHPIGARLAMFGELPVRQLRVLAREAGHRQLARSGRRAELIAALGAI